MANRFTIRPTLEVGFILLEKFRTHKNIVIILFFNFYTEKIEMNNKIFPNSSNPENTTTKQLFDCFVVLVRSRGIEPRFEAPQASVLSVERWALITTRFCGQ